MPALSTQKIARALRDFTICGVLWAIYGPNATAAGSIFSGFALKLGISESQIAFLVGLSAVVGLWELFSFYVTRRLANKPRFLVRLGMFEISSSSVIALTVFLPLSVHFPAIAGLLILCYLFGHTNSPIFNSWMSNTMPAEVRGRYLGSRMFAVTITAMLYLYLASTWLDWRGKTDSAFMTVFAVGWVGGILGYLMLARTPYPPVKESPREGLARSLLSPLRSRPFAILTLYLITWTVAGSLAGAFFGVYMINYLRLSYGRIAIYTNITLLMMMVGYLLTGSLAQRYGSKPLTQILIVPAAAVPALWAFADLHSYGWVLPVACFINGVCIAGLGIGSSNLLYKTVPAGEENSVYFATWAAAASVGAALGPFLGGLLKNYLPATIYLAGHQFTSLQAIFLLSAVLYVVPVLMTALLHEGEATSPMFLLGQFRGNLLSLAFNYGLYAVARRDGTRAGAMVGLGRSRSPLAVDRLVRGLGHVSREVRSGAARGLGEGRFEEAVEPLARELADKESDIRSEAAEALGKIGAAPSHLIQALHDEDLRVRASAAMALAELQHPEAQNALIEALGQEFDRNMFPTLVEAASHCPDLRVVSPALDGLKELTTPVVRLQVINGICRVLGEKNHFYRLATADELAESRMREKMMARVRRLLGRIRYGQPQQRAAVARLGRDMETGLDDDDLKGFASQARRVAAMTEELGETPEVAGYAALAVRRYLDERSGEESDHELVVFLIICLTALGRALAEQ